MSPAWPTLKDAAFILAAFFRICVQVKEVAARGEIKDGHREQARMTSSPRSGEGAGGTAGGQTGLLALFARRARSSCVSCSRLVGGRQGRWRAEASGSDRLGKAEGVGARPPRNQRAPRIEASRAAPLLLLLALAVLVGERFDETAAGGRQRERGTKVGTCRGRRGSSGCCGEYVSAHARNSSSRGTPRHGARSVGETIVKVAPHGS